jgi:hypothetical protein
MKTAAVSLAVLLMAASSAHAQAFDPAQCSRISDVDLPYDVTLGDSAVEFRNSHGNVTVTPAEISSAGRTYAGASVPDHYAKLRHFLVTADTMARVANPFSRRDGNGGLGDAASNMCQAILDLAASNQMVEGEFPGYTSPVRIVLR